MENREAIGIGDVAKIMGVAPHTIRFWEREFPVYLTASRTNGGQRRYTEADLVRLREVHRLLRDEGYSIAGARRILKLSPEHRPAPDAVDPDLAARVVALLRLSPPEMRAAIAQALG